MIVTILRSIPLCRPLQPSFLSCSLFSMMPCRLRSLCVTQIHVVFAFNVDAGVMFVNFHANRSSTKSHPNKQSQDHKQHGLRLSQPISYQVNQPHKVSAKSQATQEKSTQNCPTHSAPPEVVRMHWHVLLDASKIFPSSLEQSNQNHSMLRRLQTWSVKMHLTWIVVMEHSTRICWANMIDLVYHPARYFPPPPCNLEDVRRCPTKVAMPSGPNKNE